MMSTHYCALAVIAAAEMFDGRLEMFGVREHHTENTTEKRRFLTDGCNYLWVAIADDGLVNCLTRYMPNGAPGKILDAIAEAFDVDIVSEYEPEYWGFNTQEQWDAALEAIAKEDEEKFHAEILKFLKGEPHDITPDTIGMLKVQIAKQLVEEDPTLLLPMNKRKFCDAIEATYDREHSVTIALSSEDIMLAKMIVTREDDLPNA